MKFRKKVLLAALALTLTSTNSITRDIPLLNRTNVSFAAEEATKDDGIHLITPGAEYEYTPEHVRGIVEVLKDELKVLLDFKDSGIDVPSTILENFTTYENTYKSLLKLEEDTSKTDEVKYKEALVNILLNKELKENLENDKTKIDGALKALEALEEKPENYEHQKKILTSVKDKLDPIVSTLGDVEQIPEESEGVHITIKNGEGYNQYLVEKEGLKEEILELSKKIEEYKGNNESLKEEDKQQIESELNSAKELLADPRATKDELEESRDTLKMRSDNFDEASLAEKDEMKNTLATKISEIKGKLGKNYISKKYHDESIQKISTIEKEIPNANKEALNKHLEELTLMDQKIEKIGKKVTGSDVSKLIEAIEKANSNKKTQAYYRAGKLKRDNFVNAITEAETYLESVLEKLNDDPDAFNPDSYKDEIDQHIKKLTTAYDELDGLTYEDLLNKTKEKFDANKKSLSEESIKEIQKQLDLLSDMENEANTVDDINYVSNLIDEKVKKDLESKKGAKNPEPTTPTTPKTSQNSDKKGQVKVKKVAVPRAENEGNKNAKSIVRTGIDSVKVFGIVAVVAVVILIVTKKRKDK